MPCTQGNVFLLPLLYNSLGFRDFLYFTLTSGRRVRPQGLPLHTYSPRSMRYRRAVGRGADRDNKRQIIFSYLPTNPLIWNACLSALTRCQNSFHRSDQKQMNTAVINQTWRVARWKERHAVWDRWENDFYFTCLSCATLIETLYSMHRFTYVGTHGHRLTLILRLISLMFCKSAPGRTLFLQIWLHPNTYDLQGGTVSVTCAYLHPHGAER